MEEQPIRLGKGGPEIASPLGMGLWSWGDSYVSFGAGWLRSAVLRVRLWLLHNSVQPALHPSLTLACRLHLC